MADEKPEVEIDAKEAKSTKKEKKPKKEGGIPILIMAGGALGGVIMIIVSVIIGTVIANKLFPPVVPAVTGEEQVASEDAGQHTKKLKPFPEDGEDMGEGISLLEDSEWLTFDSNKTQTNLKSPAGMIGIIDIAATYKPYYVEELTEKGFLEEPGTDSHGNPTPAGANKESGLYKKLKLNVTSALIDFISSHTAEELQNLQSSGKLSDSLKTKLKNPFKDIGLIVGKVDITQFIIATM